ncbi:hypothetical protein CR969_00125 [Candidatus Saccharibacteria bacterium]|nr:MAG: hypothetical protein CR969_00125 [Candidatus Saccharibacteria bacterium]
MELSIFVQISLVIAVAAVVSIIMRFLRQPLILGYILTGVITGPSLLNIIQAHESFETLSSIGIALLLFIIGLGLNAKLIRSLGKPAIVTAFFVGIFLGPISFLVSYLFGFNVISSLFIANAMLFSSTIVILKTLSDKHEMGRLYGRLAIGILLIEDIMATLAMIMATMLAKDAEATKLIWLLAEAGGLALLLYVFGSHIIPKIGKFLASSRELLFLFSIGWGLSIASLFEVAGFSAELGALFAGVALAGLPYATEMAARLKPLRDFFLVLFFVSLGELFSLGSISVNLLPALALSALIMIGKPLLVMSSLSIMKYTNLTSYKTAIHLSQNSEFSIVLVLYAAQLGVVSENAVSLVTLVVLITIALSTYLTRFEKNIYKSLEKVLRKFERKELHKTHEKSDVYPAILIGYRKGGYEFVRTFRKLKLRYLVIDYNPEIIERLEQQGVRHAYGDIMDEEFLEEINIGSSKVIVSTVDDLEMNLSVLKYIRKNNKNASYICHALTYEDATELYEAGASYVILPHYVGSERISNFIKQNGISHKSLSDYRNKHLVVIGKKAVAEARVD